MTEAPRDEVTAKWVPIITAYEREVEVWEKRSKRIIKRYKDERSAREKGAARYNVLWSNIETLKPALFAKTPKADVQRRFKDKDPVGRVASDVLERCLDYNLEQHSFGSTMRQGVLDYLLCGRGTAWARYVPHMRDMEMPEGVEVTEDDDTSGAQSQLTNPKDADEKPQEVYYEEALPDYVHWQDFGHTEARTWEEVSAVWRIAYMTRRQLIERFGKDLGKEIKLDFSPKGMDEQNTTDVSKKATIYEIWDRDTKKAFWISKHHPKALDERDDPLKLDKFFPCPRPLYATLANDSLIPVPDYVEYQDQADEMDELTGRISSITKAIKVAGVADSSAQGIQRLLTEGVENILIPIESWAAFAEKGGLKGSMELLPMIDIAQTLLHLYDAREKVKADLYEITGMADIIRGSTNPNETATAQKIKSNFVTMRLDERQREVQRFARNVVEILGQIIAGHFSLETIQKMSGVQLLTNEQKQQVSQQQAQMQQMAQQAQQPPQPGMPPPPPMQPPPPIPQDMLDLMAEPSWEDVYALLQNETARCFRIDIETDSTIAGDEDQAKQDAMEFAKNIGGFIEQIGQVAPGLQPLMGHMLSFMVRAFPVGKNLEAQLESTLAEMEKAAKQPPKPPQPDPTKMAEIQAKGQMHVQSLQADQQASQAQLQASGQLEMQKAQIKAQSDAQAAQNKAAQEQAQSQIDAQLEAHKATVAAQTAEAQRQHEMMMEQIKQQGEDRRKQLDNDTKILIAQIAAKTAENAQAQAAQEGADAAVAKEDGGSEVLSGIKEVLEHLKKPRTIVRDANGRAIGVKTE